MNKVGDLIICIDLKQISSHWDIKLSDVFKIRKINEDCLIIKPQNNSEYGFWNWRFRKALPEEIVKAKLLGRFYE